MTESIHAWREEMEEADLWFDAGSNYAAARTWRVILAHAYEKSGNTACDIIAHALDAFASNARAAERERCAQIALQYRDEADAGKYPTDPLHPSPQGYAANRIAKRIRAEPPQGPKP